MGTADGGHYYSLINVKRGSEEPRPDVDEEKWRKVEKDNWKVFDDANVKHFNFNADMKKEAFGGEQDNQFAGKGDAMSDD